MKQPRRLFIHNHGNMHCGLGWLIAQAGVPQPIAIRNLRSPASGSNVLRTRYPPTTTDGWILWDTTCPRDWNTHWAAPGNKELFPYDDVKDGQYFDESLNAMGIGVEDIKYVIQSHLHADHSRNVKHFKNTDATLICTTKEYEGAIASRDPSRECTSRTITST